MTSGYTQMIFTFQKIIVEKVVVNVLHYSCTAARIRFGNNTIHIIWTDFASKKYLAVLSYTLTFLV